MKTVAIRQALAPHSLIANPYKKLFGSALSRWVRDSGFAWAADRCKSVVQHLLKLRAGEETKPPAWISHRFLSYPERIALNGSENKFFQIVQTWRLFTLYGENERLTSAAIQKFEHACLDLPTWQEGGLSGDTVNPRLEIDLSWFGGNPNTTLPEVRLPQVIPVKNPLALRSQDPDGSLSREWEELRFDTNTLAHLREHVWQVEVEKMPFALRQMPLLSFGLTTQKTNATFGCIGNVYARVQKDGKCRFYYAPPSWVQFLIGDWGKCLYDALRNIKQDCTFDQESGVKKVRDWLKEGKKVYSFDLSSATDRFPLALTRSILMGLSHTSNMRMWVDTFCFLSRVPAGVQYGLDEDLVGSHLEQVLETGNVKWNVGQPLGMLPSFAAFALSHHWLVRSCFKGRCSPSDAPYVILGDDLVIADDDAASVYLQYCNALGVEISQPKSLAGRLGEFAGRVIGSEGYEFKLKYFHITPRTLLSAISLLGPRALKGMRQSRLRDVIALLPTPRTPSGCNPGGFPRDKVGRFLTEYFYLSRDLEVDGELWVDSVRAVKARLGALNAITFSTSPSAHCWSVAPRGAATTGYGGVPTYGPRKGSSTWRWSPYLSRAWITRVKRAAKAARIM